MKQTVRIFPSPYELAEKLAEEIVEMIKHAASKNTPLTVALSGGSTPELLFSILGDHFSASAPWKYVHFFWGDERCVPPVSPDSNFGMAFRSFFKKIDIPERNIHRIYGEQDCPGEALRYSDLISEFTKRKNGVPVFDLILLGLGEDGHTASIFPDNLRLFESDKICDVSFHPLSKQKRITITGKVINNAENIKFLVTGRSKAGILKKILERDAAAKTFPASLVTAANGKIEWLLDSEAGSLLKK